MTMQAARQVQREWLDELPADDPRAIRSRRDLIRVNAWMLQPGIMARALSAHHGTNAPRTMLDLGSGDGTFMLRVATALARQWRDVSVTMLDQQDVVSAATRRGFDGLGWRCTTITGDLFAVLEDGRLGEFDIITANLFLHHFTEAPLARLMAGIAPRTSLFVACEPRRAALPLLASRMLWVIGCNDVSRHDAVVSVQAGFNDHELSAIWPDPDRWQLHEHAARLFTHCFVAHRRQEGQQCEI
jgi:2-polyprenyl-3-methyl-5-hydroxy-6-metoxy-1,4-benzoquinol methylase